MRSSAILTTAIRLCGVYALSRRDEIVEQAAARTANQYIVEYKTVRAKKSSLCFFKVLLAEIILASRINESPLTKVVVSRANSPLAM